MRNYDFFCFHNHITKQRNQSLPYFFLVYTLHVCMSMSHHSKPRGTLPFATSFSSTLSHLTISFSLSPSHTNLVILTTTQTKSLPLNSSTSNPKHLSPPSSSPCNNHLCPFSHINSFYNHSLHITNKKQQKHVPIFIII